MARRFNSIYANCFLLTLKNIVQRLLSLTRLSGRSSISLNNVTIHQKGRTLHTTIENAKSDNFGSPPPRRPSPCFVSVVTPVFNEEEGISLFCDTLSQVLEGADLKYEIVFIDDGSTDSTRDILWQCTKAKSNVRALILSRNFGKEAALTAGIADARGDAIVPMDVDLQDPPELIIEFVKKWHEGYDVVYGVRSTRSSDSMAKRLTASWFYRLFNSVSDNKIPENVGDFRLMDRRVVEALGTLTERSRFMKGLFSWVGYKSIGVEFERPERVLGTSKWNYWKLWNFALDGIFGFSTVPLRVWTYLGLLISVLAFAYGMVTIVVALVSETRVPGYASLMTTVLFLGGIQVLSLGVMGEYLGRLFIEAKRRPIFLVDQVFESDAENAGDADSRNE